MTTRTISLDTTGPIALDLTMNAGNILIIVNRALEHGQVFLKTTADTGPSADAVRDTTVDLVGQNLKIRVPDTGHSGSVTFHGGGVIVTGSMSNVSVVNGRVFSNGREITPDNQNAAPPITAEIHLPPKSIAKLRTQTASTEITGRLPQLDYEATSGRLTAEYIDDLDAILTSGELLVGQVLDKLDVTLTSGNFAVGIYSGNDARLYLTSGSARLHAVPAASGKLSVTATSGFANITGASHLDVRRRVTSGSVRIS